MTPRTRHLPWIIAAVVLAAGPAPAQEAGAGAPAEPGAGDDAASALRDARHAYVYGDYPLVVSRLAPLVDSGVLLGERELIEARRMLGLSGLFLAEEDADPTRKQELRDGAERQFLALLTLDPDHRLDPLIDPPAFIAVFERLRERHRAELDAARRRRAQAQKAAAGRERALGARVSALERELDRARANVTVIDRTERSRLVATLPFGAGQFQNGQRGKGLAFLVSELVLGAASAGMFTFALVRYPDGRHAESEASLANGLEAGVVVTGAAFWALAVWGAIDAHAHFRAASYGSPRSAPRDALEGVLAW